MSTRYPRWFSRGALLPSAGALLLCATTAAAAPITFTDTATNPTTGISYRRIRSTTAAIFDMVKQLPFLSTLELNQVPDKSEGAPGVAVIDFDNDGDDDIYATNGPGRANSLYRNMHVETGVLRFSDIAVAAGVDATSQDSTGTCYGDIDNDGDPDLLVLGRMESSRLFRNNGNRTFTNITATAGVGTGALGHTSCSMGDINGDGLLDIYIANTYDWVFRAAIYTQSFAFSHRDELYLNLGGNTFQDVTVSAGLTELHNVPPGDSTITWAVALVDIDQDGDTDIQVGDDQAAMPTSGFAGVDRGFMQTFLNDGTGHFTNVTVAAGFVAPGAWMGLSYGDINYDGLLDVFSSNAGDYIVTQFGFPVPPGLYSSRWFVQDAPGHWVSNTLPEFGVTPFGWGTGMADYDNDGATDIIFYGALDATPFVTADNPGMVLRNDGTGIFSWDRAATASSATSVLRQIVQGVGLGDFNRDGFVDIARISSAYHAPNAVPLIPAHARWNHPVDDTAFILPTFMNIGPLEWEWSKAPVEEGFLGVEMSSANNGNKWVKVTVRGSKAVIPNGAVNRSGIGAIVKFTPRGSSRQSISPVLGGSSYASQHSMAQGFGLGGAGDGVVDIMWPGGVNNRLYDVAHGEHVFIPEVPCDYAANWGSEAAYMTCVDNELQALLQAHQISGGFRNRLRNSARRAYRDTH